ncbi:ATP-grasp domain-containing protein [Marinobacterium maritimum]|uniref:ATP-grasp domain-containing protein n=1 Tax=Marinobacterium maritimum TaxID=500162 RepID=A0ABP3T8H3_9GAMM
MSSTKNIFVFGEDSFNLEQMEALQEIEPYRFHPLFRAEEVKLGGRLPIEQLYEEALARLDRFEGSVDAIVGYWDFPVSTMLPLLRAPYAMPSPSLEALLKCEHKYWSRVEQKRAVPEYVPAFGVIDPFVDDYRDQVSLEYPFWIKPVKSVASMLGFRVASDEQLDEAIAAIRRDIHIMGRPFNDLLKFAHIPDEIAPIDGKHCVIEEIISEGDQCTLEGYVYHGEVVVYGVVDSLREGLHHSCFSRYQYPSKLPQPVKQEMAVACERFFKHIGFDNGPFNVEFFWNPETGAIRLLEVNPRISQSHCPLFRDVDGLSHHKVMIDLGLGRKPDFPQGVGTCRLAAKFMWRLHMEDGLVTHLPNREELEHIKRRFANVDFHFIAHEGQRLSDLKGQDSYSYEIANIYIGGNTEPELLDTYEEIKQAVALQVVPVG